MEILSYVICIFLFLLATIIVSKIIVLKNIVYKEPEILANKKVLVVYYSNNGNTKNIAENLKSVTSGDIKEIELNEKYSDNIFKMSKLVRKQLKEGYLPKINNIDISGYDVVFVCSPIWDFSISLPVKSFLKNNNFENKIIIPFFTYSGGAGKNKLIKEIENLTGNVNIKNPLFMFENGIILVKEQIINLLNKLPNNIEN